MTDLVYTCGTNESTPAQSPGGTPREASRHQAGLVRSRCSQPVVFTRNRRPAVMAAIIAVATPGVFLRCSKDLIVAFFEIGARSKDKTINDLTLYK